MRSRRLLLLGVVLACLAIAWCTLTRGHDWGDDFASYILQAQAILDGTTRDFIQHNSFTIRESSFQIGPVAYPWGYPLILAPALMVRGLDPLALKVAGLLFFAAFLVALHLLTSDHLPTAEGLLLVALFAFSPVLLGFLDHVLSDVPQLCLLFVGLVWVERRRAGPWSAAALGAVIFLAFFVRTAGIVLLGSVLAWQALRLLRERERRREILVDAAATLSAFLLLWGGASLVFPGGQASYFRPLDGVSAWSLRFNRYYYFQLLGTFLGSGAAWDRVYHALIVLFLIGLWSRRRQDQHLILFFLAYLALVLLWPMRQGIRFAFPLLPIGLYLAFQGARAVTEWLPKRFQQAGRVAFGCAWLLLAGSFLFDSVALASRNLRADRRIAGPFDEQSAELFRFVREATPADSVIVFFKPRALRLFAQRDSVLITRCHRLAVGDYLALSKEPAVGQLPAAAVGGCGLPLRNVFENRTFVVYELPRTPP